MGKKAFECFIIFCLILGSGAEASAKSEVDELSLGDLLNLEVTVATKTKSTMQDAPSIVSVITGEEIRNMGARNLVDVLRTVPGFDVSHSVVQPANNPIIRGLQSIQNNKSKLMINGHWVNVLDGSSGFHMERLPIGNIKRIEIIRGPGSALYGASAFLGVINIITEEGGDGPSEIAMEAGSNDTFHPSGQLSYKNGEFKAHIYADYYTTDGDDRLIESDFASSIPVFGSAAPGKMDGKETHYNCQTRLSYKDVYFNGILSKIDIDPPIGPAGALTDESNANEIYLSGELGLKLPLSDKGNLLVKTYYDYSDIKRKNEIFPEETGVLYGFPEGEGLYGNPYLKTSTLGGEVTVDYEIYSGVQLVGGALYDYYKQFDTKHYANFNTTGRDFELNGIIYPPFPFQHLQGGVQDISDGGNWSLDENRTTIALYSQGTLDLKDLLNLEKGVKNLTLTAGLRYDDYDDMGSTVNPRFGLVYAPTEKLYFKALYGEAFRAPNFSELYTINNPNILGNPDLSPETITTAELLVGYNFTSNIRATVTYFNLTAEDLLVTKDNLYQNEGEMESQGVEGELRISFDRLKYAYVNFTWQDVTDTTNKAITSTGGQVYSQGDFDPGSYANFMANIGANYDFFNEHVLANASLNYVGKKDRSEKKEWQGETLVQADQRDPVDERWLLNASLTFRKFYKGLEFQLSGFNLLDDDHRDPASTATGITYDMPQTGRTFMARMSYSF